MLHNNNNNKKMIILVSVDFLWATIDLWYMSFPFVCYFCFALESIEEETTKTVMVIALRYSFTSFFMYFTCLFWAENEPYCCVLKSFMTFMSGRPLLSRLLQPIYILSKTWKVQSCYLFSSIHWQDTVGKLWLQNLWANHQKLSLAVMIAHSKCGICVIKHVSLSFYMYFRSEYRKDSFHKNKTRRHRNKICRVKL